MNNLRKFKIVALLLIFCLLAEQPAVYAKSYKNKYADVSSLFETKKSDQWLSLGLSLAASFIPTIGTKTPMLNGFTNFSTNAFTGTISNLAMTVAMDKWNFNPEAAQVFGYGMGGLAQGLTSRPVLGQYNFGSGNNFWNNSHPALRGAVGGFIKGSAIGGANLLTYEALKNTGFYRNNPYIGNQLSSLIGGITGKAVFNTLATGAGFDIPGVILDKRSLTAGLKHTWSTEKTGLLANSVGLGIEYMAAKGAFGDAFENSACNRLLGSTATALTGAWLTPEKHTVSTDSGKLKKWQRWALAGILAGGGYAYFDKHKDTGLASVLAANIGTSALFASIGAKAHSRSVLDSALQGANAGLLMFASKDFMASNIDYGFFGKLAHSAGVSMRDNLFKGNAALSRYEFDFGPLLIGLNFDKPDDRVDFALLPWSTIMLIYEIGRGSSFDLKNTLKTGALAFKGKADTGYGSSDFNLDGKVKTNIITIEPGEASDKSLLVHENIHSLQYAEDAILGLPFDNWIKKQTDSMNWIRFDKGFGMLISSMYDFTTSQEHDKRLGELEPELWQRTKTKTNKKSYSADPLLVAGLTQAGFLWTFKNFDANDSFPETAAKGIVSGLFSVGLNNLAGRYNPKTGENKWGLTRTQMAGVNWLGVNTAQALAGAIKNHSLSSFAQTFKDSAVETSLRYTSGLNDIEKIAQFGGYANFKANADLLMKQGGYTSWKEFVADAKKHDNFRKILPGFEDSLVDYTTSVLHYSTVDSLTDSTLE